MRTRLHAARILCPAFAGLLAACGQTGPLYLPDAAVTTPVEVRPAPTAPSPAGPAETPAPPVDPGKDKKPAESPPATGD